MGSSTATPIPPVTGAPVSPSGRVGGAIGDGVLVTLVLGGGGGVSSPVHPDSRTSAAQ
ncbi:hypothetical protein AB0C38_02425 [Amycolatopsis sp. NPDC048633]|uniref:hypothetical protein n=1 Tax=Amycolatopsis sp. NPDC048633 TaxID=3157095 RepID=UPI0033FE1E63